MTPPRLYIAGLSVHVIQRGNNRGRIFDEDVDYQVFLAMLEAASAKNGLSVHGLALMTNHFHLML